MILLLLKLAVAYCYNIRSKSIGLLHNVMYCFILLCVFDIMEKIIVVHVLLFLVCAVVCLLQFINSSLKSCKHFV